MCGSLLDTSTEALYVYVAYEVFSRKAKGFLSEILSSFIDGKNELGELGDYLY